MSHKTSSLKYELLLLVMSMIWGSTFVAQQIGMERGLGPMTFNGLRFTLGCLWLMPVVIWRRRYVVTKEEGRLPVLGSLAAGVFLFAAANVQQVGLQYTSSANAGFITGLYLLFVPLIGMLFGHKTTWSLWVGIVVSLIGLYLLSMTGEGFAIAKGDGLILICAVLWACQILVIDHVSTRGDPFQIACLQFAFCAVLSLAVAVCFETWTLEAIKAGAGAVAYAGIMSVGIAFSLQVICQKHCPPGPAAVIMSTEAIFAALTGYFVLHQTLTVRALFGCGLILCGVLIVQLVPIMRRRRRRDDGRGSK